jgi:hypothetical protein
LVAQDRHFIGPVQPTGISNTKLPLNSKMRSISIAFILRFFKFKKLIFHRT